ncbi:LytTR family DNA-binding domain-containing protein [Candidatus Enterococcus murrayae]|uniref:LytTR family transcriptional regulator DNA-binding domain-containing protein n=1 Tax=Candidatus Enterococcus murrayae TaxID=2815321 RepID=A0ABS3HJ81_9ENTE|nr:LytTR family DNA-binding domain-containing protein [Enterococcus sp. MJM16]MBO0453062.1 LytTR family transcriptional regulator DNA-binding domain-containing protein [Enterococcus sp. MJM16]
MFKGVRIQMEIEERWTEPEVRIRAAEEAIGNQIASRLEAYQEEQLVIKVKDEYILLNKAEIIYLEVFNKIVTLYTANQEYSFRKSLTALKEELPSELFLQISKSALVNTREIQKLEVAFSGSLYAYLKNGQKVTISRRFVDRLKRHLGV